MAILTAGLQEVHPYDGWYESELDFHVDRLAAEGICIGEDRVGTRSPGYGVSFSGFYSQGDGLAFDSTVDWPKFIEANPSFKEQMPVWFLLLAANPNYFKVGTVRNPRWDNTMRSSVDDEDVETVVEHGFFAGVEIDSIKGLDIPDLEQYYKDACVSEARNIYNILEEVFESECEYLQEQQMEQLIEKNTDFLKLIIGKLLLEGATFNTFKTRTMGGGLSVDTEDLEVLGLIKAAPRWPIGSVTQKGKDLLCTPNNDSQVTICTNEPST